MEFGKTLREAREAKGYTVSQLAEITHILPRTIEGLEAEDFSSIPAPIYGRGFVKLCCQHLGLEQQPMIEEFMAIFTGEKPASRPMPASSPAVVAPAMPEEATGKSAGPEVAAPEPPPPSPFGELFNQPREPPPAPQTKPSRFAPPKPMDLEFSRKVPLSLPVIPWRLVILAFAVIAILWGVIAGCRAAYRALSAPPERPAASKPSTPATSGHTAGMQRSPKPVKPLYID